MCRLANFNKCNFISLHLQERKSQEFEIVRVIHKKFICNFPLLLEVNKLAIIEPGFVTVVYYILWISEGSNTLSYNKLDNRPIANNISCP